MKRDVTFEEISDGFRYKASDDALLPCNDCSGCHECCSVTADTILLDPKDIYELSKVLNKSFLDMQDKEIEFTVIDGVITPYLCKNEDESCIFLDKNYRCSIHKNRPGFCRLFPLGRIYNEDGSFDYFVQIHECNYPHKAKQSIEKWLGIDEITQYEQYIVSWHEIISNIRDFACECDDENLSKQVMMKYLTAFYAKPYDTSSDFYTQFYERVALYQR